MALRCKWCSIRFKNSEELNEHMQTDSRKHPYYCQRCGHTFQTFRKLKEHYARSPRHDASDDTEMMNESESYCRYCRRQFETAGQLTTHFTHTHPENLQCKTCGMWFRYRSNLDQHLASPVHDAAIIPCPHCSELFKTTSGIAHHLEYKCLKRVTEAIVRWDENNQITNRVYTDRIREVESEDEEDDILVVRRDPGIQQILEVMATEDAWSDLAHAYVCPVPECERHFKRLGHLNQHLRSQKHRTDPSTFRCPKCSRNFSVVSALVQHLESGACGLAGSTQVKQIYTGLHDMFKRLLTFTPAAQAD